MQTMSTEMVTLLKSKTMIGPNKPVAEVVVGGGGGEITPETPRVLRGADGVYEELPNTFYSNKYIMGGDIAKRVDGKLLTTYSVGTNIGGVLQNGIYLSVFDDEETLFGYDNIAQDSEFLFITTESEVTSFLERINSLLRLEDGRILLFIMNDDSASGIMTVKCYESANGLGTDFVYKSTVYSWDYSALPNVYSRAFNVGNGIILESGRILLPLIGGANMYSTTGTTQAFACYSDDNGLTWNSSASVLSAGWYKSIRVFRGFGIINGSRLIAQIGYIVYEGGMAFVYSDDGGETWDVYDGWQGVDSVEEVLRGIYYNPYDGYTYYTMNTIYNEPKYRIYRIPSSKTIADVDIYTHGIWGEPLFDTVFGDDNYENIIFINSQYFTLIGQSNFDGTLSHMFGFEVARNVLQPKSIQISRAKGMAGGLTVELDNKDGVLAPDGTVNPQLLWPNKEIVVKQGYGSELLTTFTGLIDSVSMSTFPQTITISARDMMKPLLDHYLRNAEFLYTLTYTNMTVEHIWENLMILAGVEYNIIEETGLTISEKTFSWETYGDAISWLDEIAGFETYCDEFGKMNFVRDGRPVDVTVAYEFEEGVDITRLGYEINDNDLYYTVAVYGKSPEVLDENDEVVTESMVIYFAKQLPQATYWNISSGKVLRIDAPDADTLAKCEIIADKAIYLMQTRARQVTFETIGIPHLQRGDFIQVTESSTTISEIYRITDISTSQDSSGYRMTLTCYYHAAPEVGK